MWTVNKNFTSLIAIITSRLGGFSFMAYWYFIWIQGVGGIFLVKHIGLYQNKKVRFWLFLMGGKLFL